MHSILLSMTYMCILLTFCEEQNKTWCNSTKELKKKPMQSQRMSVVKTETVFILVSIILVYKCMFILILCCFID